MGSDAASDAGGRYTMARSRTGWMLAALVLAAGAVMTRAQAPAPANDPLRAIAERYVRLVLAVGQHDGDYVDAYYGPPEWRKEAEASKVPLPTLDAQAA